MVSFSCRYRQDYIYAFSKNGKKATRCSLFYSFRYRSHISFRPLSFFSLTCRCEMPGDGRADIHRRYVTDTTTTLISFPRVSPYLILLLTSPYVTTTSCASAIRAAGITWPIFAVTGNSLESDIKVRLACCRVLYRGRIHAIHVKTIHGVDGRGLKTVPDVDVDLIGSDRKQTPLGLSLFPL